MWDSCSSENKCTIEKFKVEALEITIGGTKVCSLEKLFDHLISETLRKDRYILKNFLLYKITNST